MVWNVTVSPLGDSTQSRAVYSQIEETSSLGTSWISLVLGGGRV